MSPLLALLLLASGLGLLLLLFGLRGQFVGERPHCRGCGFDLSGTPLKSAPCPECGADLTPGLAVRRGRRKRRPWFIGTGAGLTMLSLAAFGSLVWGASTNFNWNTIKPDWLLVMHTGSTDSASAAPALDELMSRCSNGSLGHKHVRRLLERGLRIQADPEAPWLTGWGDFIVTGWRQGDLSDEEFQAYARRGFATAVRLRNRVRAEESVHPILEIRGDRLGDTPTLFVHFEASRLSSAGRSLTAVVSKGSINALPGRVTSYQIVPVNGLPPGTHTLESTWRIGVSDSREPGPDILWWTVTHSTEVTAVAAGEPLVNLVHDPAAKDAISENIQLLALGAIPIDQDRSSIDIRLRVKPLPHTISMQILIRADGAEYPLFSLLHREHEEAIVYSARPRVTGLNARLVDIVMRPDIERAEQVAGVDNIWNGEIIIEDVPVHWPKGLPDTLSSPPPAPKPDSP